MNWPPTQQQPGQKVWGKDLWDALPPELQMSLPQILRMRQEPPPPIPNMGAAGGMGAGSALPGPGAPGVPGLPAGGPPGWGGAMLGPPSPGGPPAPYDMAGAMQKIGPPPMPPQVPQRQPFGTGQNIGILLGGLADAARAYVGREPHYQDRSIALAQRGQEQGYQQALAEAARQYEGSKGQYAFKTGIEQQKAGNEAQTYARGTAFRAEGRAERELADKERARADYQKLLTDAKTEKTASQERLKAGIKAQFANLKPDEAKKRLEDLRTAAMNLYQTDPESAGIMMQAAEDGYLSATHGLTSDATENQRGAFGGTGTFGLGLGSVETRQGLGYALAPPLQLGADLFKAILPGGNKPGEFNPFRLLLGTNPKSKQEQTQEMMKYQRLLGVPRYSKTNPPPE